MKKLNTILSSDTFVGEYLDHLRQNGATMALKIAKFEVNGVFRLKDPSFHAQYESLCMRVTYDGNEWFVVL